jgi:BirA family transcriptional regulator, biotin operon repressor / biotin---[acetyl-CoA-carboxylase] ligase
MPPTTQAERVGDSEPAVLGRPRVHLRRTDSTNERARELAIAGAPHGTLVSAAEQTAGRGRQGRSWAAPAGSALLCSFVLRDPPTLLSLIAGVAVCDVVGERARVKWPNDIVVDHDLGKLAGILVEGRPQEGWAVLGIGVNVAVRAEELPAEVRAGAASLESPPSAIEPLLANLLGALALRLAEPADTLLDVWRARDALCGREITWAHPKGTRQGHGRAEGIDNEGRLLVRQDDGTAVALSAGEVHLESIG